MTERSEGMPGARAPAMGPGGAAPEKELPHDADHLAAELDALAGDGAAVATTVDVVRVEGPDATKFLQGQLSQDIGALGAGGDAPTDARAWLLQPTGKVDALLHVALVAADTYDLVAAAGRGAAVLTRLQRFKLRTKAELTLDEGVAALAVRGAIAVAAARAGCDDARVIVGDDWPSGPGAVVVGTHVLPTEVGLVSGAALEAARITAGVPVDGRDLGPDTIPAEAGAWLIEAAVSFTKGCFTGQELVARIDSRGGNVPRPLRVVHTPDGAVPTGARLLDAAGAEVGSLTSVASTPDGATIGLGPVSRKVVPDATSAMTLAWDGGEAPATVVAAVAPATG
ncbi:MAG: hypothetical protein WKF93_05570, partial [Acidimicrobiales bacterium]